ncbi:MAG: hypothetical protein R8M70_04810 [Alphaproteobacteria bacterium]|nr:hypothetical protein [Alphaproteobacteria bacterium]
MQLNAGTAEKMISDMGMSDLPLFEIRPTSCPVSSNWFSQYKSLCHDFMLSLTDSVETLAFMDLSQDEFMNIITGRALPQNISIRFRTPLIWGGKLETDNMFMCWTFPHSYNMDRFIIAQSDAKTIWLPNPSQKIYLPTHTAGGGDGGNATEDRLAQIGAQIASSRDI